VEAILKQALPSPQGVALALLQACQRDTVSIAELTELVRLDPALSGRLLEHANVAASGSRRVAAVGDAVSRLGLRAVCQLALGFSLIDQYRSGRCAALDYQRFWSQSLLMAVSMRQIGALAKLSGTDELYSCGLLARVGVLALATAYPLEYALVLNRQLQGPDLLQLERDFLQTDHLLMAHALLEQWGLPALFLEAVQHQEERTPEGIDRDSRAWQLTQLLHLSWRLAEFLVDSPHGELDQISDIDVLAGQLGIEEKSFRAAVDSSVRQWRSLGATLQVPVPELPPFAEIVGAGVRPDQQTNTDWLRVLVVEDDPFVRDMLAHWLRKECGFSVLTADDGRRALALALEFKPHVVVTDWLMPEMDGLQLCQALRASAWGQSIYVLMLTGVESQEKLFDAFEAGVDDYLNKPVNLRILTARLKAAWRYVRLRDAWESDHERLTLAAAELALSNRRLQHAALTDPLTGLANRRAGTAALLQAWSSCTRHGHQLSVIGVDADHFKNINDSYGHFTGDVVLQALSKCLREAARAEDTVCRWGGEEFMLICPNLSVRDGALMAERLRRSVATLTVAETGRSLTITISLGLAAWRSGMNAPDQLLAEVDQALYAAKKAGRNCLAVMVGGQLRVTKPT
jgi:diguanylate cyclase (GGDEF)-like protein